MSDIIYDGVDIFNPLDGKLDQLIEVFVSFYGEKYRPQITKRLNNTTFVFLPKYDNNQNSGEKYVEKHFDDLCANVYEKLNTQFGFLQHGDDIIEPNVVSLLKEALKRDEYELSEKAHKIVERFADICGIKFKKGLFAKDEIDIKKIMGKNKDKIFSKMNEYLDLYVNSYGLEIAKIHQEKNRIFKELKDVCPSMVAKNGKVEKECFDLLKDYYEQKVESVGIFELYSDIDNTFNSFYEVFKAKKIPFFATVDQRDEYIKVFKLLGFDYGDDYSAYLKECEAIEKVIFDKDICQKYEQIQDDFFNYKIDENKPLCEALDGISVLGFKDAKERTAVLMSVFDFVYSGNNTLGFIKPYVDSDNQIKHICVCSDYFMMIPNCLIHECNHIVQTNLVEDTEKCSFFKTGFDIVPVIKQEFTKEEIDRFWDKTGHRILEGFNEILNEYISEKLLHIAHKQGLKFGVNESLFCSYKAGYSLFEGFIDKNLDFLVDYCMSGSEKLAINNNPKYRKLVELANNTLYYNELDTEKAMAEIKAVFKDAVSSDMCRKLAYADSRFFDWSDNVKKFFDGIRTIDEVSVMIAGKSDRQLN